MQCVVTYMCLPTTYNYAVLYFVQSINQKFVTIIVLIQHCMRWSLNFTYKILFYMCVPVLDTCMAHTTCLCTHTIVWHTQHVCACMQFCGTHNMSVHACSYVAHTTCLCMHAVMWHTQHVCACMQLCGTHNMSVHACNCVAHTTCLCMHAVMWHTQHVCACIQLCGTHNMSVHACNYVAHTTCLCMHAIMWHTQHVCACMQLCGTPNIKLLNYQRVSSSKNMFTI